MENTQAVLLMILVIGIYEMNAKHLKSPTHLLSKTHLLLPSQKHYQPPEQEATDGCFQSDIKLTKDQSETLRAIELQTTQRRLGRRKAIAVLARRWPDGIVPYEISSSSQVDTDAILEAIDHWETNTCLEFPPYNSTVHTSWIRFIKDVGCWSYVGRVGGGYQNISIGFTCEMFGTIVHEIGHAIGFWHEHSRLDRDNYVTIHFENIETGAEHNFQKYSSLAGDSYNVTYDVGSIMHYGDKYFSKNNLTTITAINPAEQSIMGQRDSLSEADIQLAKLIYNCPPGLCTDNCIYDDDGDCDDGGPGSIFKICAYGSDCTDCGIRPDPQCNDLCSSNNDGECNDGGVGSEDSTCDYGSDCEDCGVRTDALCGTTCRYNADGDCDDGGSGADYNLCTFGSDCMDCGVRSSTMPELK
ncbi:protein SpAN-like [Saccoglossus kowalevskii]|uniref:Metalloendopeptidase n=1 Tax=Saccoglossus kowalevskii TaxID=10224 RepID=A0ABM0MMJ9_SACKO|nr:PREDICTED: protein SpAN-like [Saccoglossus kowalevskii]